MRKKLVIPSMALVAVLAMIASPTGATGSGGGGRYSPAWLAKNHTKYDTTITAQYEAAIGYNTNRGAAVPGRAPTNVRMSSTSFAGNHNEFQIAINPTDNNFAIGADNDGRTSGTGVFRTTDGGRTWTSFDMPGIGSSCCDPGVAYADDGTAYFINLDTSPAVVHFMKSTDNGATWTNPSNPGVEDRPNIAIDNSATSPHHGRIYLTWSNFSMVGTTNDIYLYYSDNGGTTWSSPVNVSHTGFPSSGSAYAQSSNPTVASDGTVYVGYQIYPQGTNDSAQNKVAKSTNGGVSFATPAATISAGPNVQAGLDLAGDARGYFGTNATCTITFRHRSFPIIKTNPTTPTTVYAMWAGGELETAYNCGSLHGVHGDILFSRSTDGGVTWSAPLKVNDDPPGHDQYYPWMDVTPTGKIWIGWHDRRDDTNNITHIWYMDRSTDGGLTFGTDLRVGNFRSTPSSFIGDYAGLAASATMVLPMWWDSRNTASGDPYTARLKA
jgi:hypothetical protein